MVPGLAATLSHRSLCDANPTISRVSTMNNSGNVRKEEVDDSHWEYKRNSCSFCKMFLDSPCQTPFKTWSSCADNAKSSNLDPNSTCSQYSEALLSCSTSNDDYFRMEVAQVKKDKQHQIENGRKKYLTSTNQN